MVSRDPDSRQVRDEEGRTIPERIRARREERGLPAYRLAKQVGISPSYMSLIETGDKVPAEAVALELARVLGDEPDLYRAWVHGTRFSDPEETMAGLARLSYPESPVRRERRERRDTAASMVRSIDRLENRIAGSGVEEQLDMSFARDPAMEGIVGIPLLEEGQLPGSEVIGECRVDRWLLPAGTASAELYAYEVSPEAARRVAGKLEGGDRVILSRAVAEPLSSTGVYAAIRENGEVVLTRVLRKGDRIVLLPGKSKEDVEIVDVDPRTGLTGILLGQVVLIMRRGPGVE